MSHYFHCWARSAGAASLESWRKPARVITAPRRRALQQLRLRQRRLLARRACDAAPLEDAEQAAADDRRDGRYRPRLHPYTENPEEMAGRNPQNSAVATSPFLVYRKTLVIRMPPLYTGTCILKAVGGGDHDAWQAARRHLRPRVDPERPDPGEPAGAAARGHRQGRLGGGGGVRGPRDQRRQGPRPAPRLRPPVQGRHAARDRRRDGLVGRPAGPFATGPGRLPGRPAGVRRRPLPAPAGCGHHHAGRQGAFPDDGRVRRVRAGDDARSHKGRTCPSQGAGEAPWPPTGAAGGWSRRSATPGAEGKGMLKIGRELGVGTATVQRVLRS